MYAVYYVDIHFRRTLLGRAKTMRGAESIRKRHAAKFGLARHWYDIDDVA